MKKICTVILICLFGIWGCSHAPEKRVPMVDELAPVIVEKAEEIHAPGSLWSPGSRMASLYVDSKARKVGDIVIVQVVENASASKEAKTSASRTNKADNSITNIMGLPLDKASFKGNPLSPGIGASTDTEFEGDGKTSRKGDITAMVPASVTRVLPSGNLVIRGKKQIRLNMETQYLFLSGIVRPDDISPNNTTQSTYLADMCLDYHGSGIIGDQQKRGIISRALDKVWPF
ncbi:MAG: flagellar basal body L-ring protein FlgH [Thermodesulfobacteriota bacterium]|nr:flagellar basal body L-ring protein FlgH [Thermodesulfobacteriota bacterium]